MVTRIALMCERERYREALVIALEATEEISVLGSTTDAIECPVLIQDLAPDVLVADSPSPAAMDVLCRQPPPLPMLIIGGCPVELWIPPTCTWVTSLGPETSLRHACKVLRRIGRRHRVSPALMCPVTTPTAPFTGGTQRLTPREAEVAALLHRNLSNREIASVLHISLPTVKNHVHRVLAKFGAQRRSDLVLRSSGSPWHHTG